MAKSVRRWHGHAVRGRPEGGNANYDRLVRRTGYDPLEGGFRSAMTADELVAWHLNAAAQLRRQWELVVGFDSDSLKRRSRLERSIRRHDAEARRWVDVSERERAGLVRVGEQSAERGANATAGVQLNIGFPVDVTEPL
jgi:hypothetical protein